MIGYKVKVNMMQKGKLKQTDIIYCEVRGKDLDEETIKRRLTNNIKTWQSAYNKNEIYKCNFEIVSYEKAKNN